MGTQARCTISVVGWPKASIHSTDTLPVLQVKAPVPLDAPTALRRTDVTSTVAVRWTTAVLVVAVLPTPESHLRQGVILTRAARITSVVVVDRLQVVHRIVDISTACELVRPSRL